MTKRVKDETLLDELRDLAQELGQVPRAQDVDEKTDRSATTYQRRFGSWTAAREKAGLPEHGAWKEVEDWKKESVLRELYIERGLTQKGIAEKFGVSDTTISNYIRKHGLKDELPEPPWRDNIKLYNKYHVDGLTISEIADEWNTYDDVIHRWLHQHDISVNSVKRDDIPELRNPMLLSHLYNEEELTTVEMGERFGCTGDTVRRWMDKFGLEREGLAESAMEARRVNRAFYHTTKDGYEVAGSRVGDTTQFIRIHRLVAIAERGLDAVKDSVVHHKNEIPWDNRPKNLEVMTDSEHKQHHAEVWKEQGRVIFD